MTEARGPRIVWRILPPPEWRLPVFLLGGILVGLLGLVAPVSRATASHGAAAHAPVESGRLLGLAIDMAGEACAQLSPILSRLGVEQPVPMPDWNKQTLQAFIGLDMDAERAQKEAFLQDTLPRWYESAAHAQPGPTDYVPRIMIPDGG